MSAKSVNLLAGTGIQSIGWDEMIATNDAIKIVLLHGQGLSIRHIAREMSVSRNTIRKYLRNGGVVEYHSPQRRKGVLNGEGSWLREKFFQHDGNADVIRQELSSEKGIDTSLRTVERAVKGHREELKRKKRATVRFETPPGFQLQIDFGTKSVKIGESLEKVHLFVAKLGFSRRMYIQAFRSENLHSWMSGIEGALRYFDGVPVEILIDNPKAMVIEHNRGTHDVVLNETFKSFASYWGFTPRACVPGRPQTKGKVENGVGYAKRNCLAGREFESWEAMEAHIAKWLVEESDQRQLGDAGDTPQARFESEERMVLKALEGKAPFSSIREVKRKVSKDSFVDVDTNRYSVPWEHINKDVQVQITEEEVIILSFTGGEIARHPRCMGRNQRIEQAEHFNGIIYQRDENKSSQRTAIPEEVVPYQISGTSELERPLSEYERAAVA